MFCFCFSFGVGVILSPCWTGAFSLTGFCVEISEIVVFQSIRSWTISLFVFGKIHPLYFGFHFPPAFLSCSFIGKVSPFTTIHFSEISSIVIFGNAFFTSSSALSIPFFPVPASFVVSFFASL